MPTPVRILSEQNVFLRWLAADSDTELLEAARAVLDDPATDWEDKTGDFPWVGLVQLLAAPSLSAV
ncbi:Imm21 family immunity protein [Streptomyces nojiriensis]|uniref:Imm21 family immunity protein n=1 Tax=Streptomyces nojiriensis TaxID=66374 RepID=UPI0036497AB8